MKVLIVDDNPLFLYQLQLYLEENRYNVMTASNVNDAVQVFMDEKLKMTPFDMVVTDIIMPGKSGDALMRYIKLIDENFPIIAVTGGIENAKRDYGRFAELFADQTLLKPFEEEDLLDAIIATRQKYRPALEAGEWFVKGRGKDPKGHAEVCHQAASSCSRTRLMFAPQLLSFCTMFS